jgi:hypothetical protein
MPWWPCWTVCALPRSRHDEVALRGSFVGSMRLNGTATHSLIDPSSHTTNLWYPKVGYPKLSRQLARYHLAMALLPLPLAERSMTVSVSLRSPAVTLVASQPQVTFNATLALRISRTAWLLNADHLCPFALWTTFSSSLVSRYPHDYYEHSVSREVALCRKSRVPSR